MSDTLYMRPISIFQCQAKNDNWMVNSSQDKMEQARIAREREMEVNNKNMIESCVLHLSSLPQMLMVARSQAIEEEEMERAAEEAERRS